MPTLIVQRRYDGGGLLRRVRILVDGQERASLRAGREVWLAVESGPHLLQARFDRVPSEDVLVAVRERDVVRCRVAVASEPTWRSWAHPAVAVELDVF
jgi:hypothetical protein